MTTAPADYEQLDHDDEERRARLTGPAALVNAALWYATVAGWPVFPLKPAGKTPLTRNGFKDATVDLKQINTWWRTTPDANIGTPTGRTFDVIDIDGPDGFHSLADMWHANCPPRCCADTTCHPDRTIIIGHPVLAIAYTGGGGRHILIPPTGQSNGAKIQPGIDYRGAGGYIVLPPSVHESGRVYDWLTNPDQRVMQSAAA